MRCTNVYLDHVCKRDFVAQEVYVPISIIVLAFRLLSRFPDLGRDDDSLFGKNLGLSRGTEVAGRHQQEVETLP